MPPRFQHRCARCKVRRPTRWLGPMPLCDRCPDPGAHTFVTGDLVWIWFDTGAFGAAMLFGVVEKHGRKTYTVRWESDLRNRIEQGRTIVSPVTDPDLITDARKSLRLPEGNERTEA